MILLVLGKLHITKVKPNTGNWFNEIMCWFADPAKIIFTIIKYLLFCVKLICAKPNPQIVFVQSVLGLAQRCAQAKPT